MIRLLAFTATLFSAPLISRALADDAVRQDLTVAVPVSRFAAGDPAVRAPGNAAARAETGRIEISASSWAPRDFAWESRVSVPAFGPATVPQLGLSFLSAPLLQPRGVALSWSAGISFQSFSRESAIQGGAGSLPRTETQGAYLIPARLGVEATPSALHNVYFSPLATFSVLPTLALVNRSAFSDGAAAVGIPLELSLGGTSEFPGRAIGLRGLSVAGALLVEYGSLRSADLDGVALRAGLRWTL
jgi:hypothetical protein